MDHFWSMFALLGVIEHTQQRVSLVVLQACLLIQLLAYILFPAILADIQSFLSETGKNSALQADVPRLTYPTAHIAITARKYMLSLADVLGLQIFP